MIEQIDRELADWATTVVPDAAVVLTPPGAGAEDDRLSRISRISLYLMDLRNTPPARSGLRPPQQVMLRYLVTTWTGNPAEEHRWLGELVFAALAAPDMEVELDALPVTLWTAFGVVPRPAFVLRVPLQRPRPESVVPRVSQEMTVTVEAVEPVHGQPTEDQQ